MSMHSKTEYQVLAGWATLDYGITTVDEFCEWMMRVKHINPSDIIEDRDLVTKVFHDARNLRKEELVNSIIFLSDFLSKQCEKAIMLDLLDKDTVAKIMSAQGLSEYIE